MTTRIRTIATNIVKQLRQYTNITHAPTDSIIFYTQGKQFVLGKLSLKHKMVNVRKCVEHSYTFNRCTLGFII